MKLWQQNILSILLGALIGANFYHQLSYIKALGDFYIYISKMIAIPMIFFMIIKSITSLAKEETLKNLIVKAFIIFIGVAVVAALIGIFIPTIFFEQSLNFSSNVVIKNNTLAEIIINILSKFVENNVIQVVLLALFIAYALLKIKTQNTYIYKLVDEVSALLLEILQLVLKFTPIAMFSYSVWLAGTLNFDTILKVSQFIQILLLAYIVQLIAVAFFLRFYAKTDPKNFFKNSFEYQLLAFSTGSSKASLPFTINQAIDKLGTPPLKANLLIPLASSINVAGLSIYLAVMAIFFANFYNVELQLSSYIIIFILAVLAPIGAAGIAGGAILVMPMMLTSLNLPMEGLVLLTAIDPIINGIRTAINITTDVGITLTLAKRAI